MLSTAVQRLKYSQKLLSLHVYLLGSAQLRHATAANLLSVI